MIWIAALVVGAMWVVAFFAFLQIAERLDDIAVSLKSIARSMREQTSRSE